MINLTCLRCLVRVIVNVLMFQVLPKFSEKVNERVRGIIEIAYVSKYQVLPGVTSDDSDDFS